MKKRRKLSPQIQKRNQVTPIGGRKPDVRNGPDVIWAPKSILDGTLEPAQSNRYVPTTK